MRKEDIKVVLFAAVVCIVCSLILSSAASVLKERQDIAVELDRQLNVLKAFGEEVIDADGKKLGKEQVDKIFTDHISEIYILRESGDVVESPDVNDLKLDAKARTHESRKLLPLYVWKDGGVPSKYAFPTAGMGLWSIVHGYVALESDLATVIGVTFYKHGETPGLGGEVSTEWFQNQFKDKKIFKEGSLVPLTVAKGAAAVESDTVVDGISGATMTGNGLNIFINRDIEYYEKYFSRIRGS